MIRRFNNYKAGYSTEKAAEVLELNKPCINVTVQPELVREYDEVKHQYGAVIGRYYYIVQTEGRGQNPIKVKILGDEQNCNFGDQVMIKGLKACEVHGKMYFKADAMIKVDD